MAFRAEKMLLDAVPRTLPTTSASRVNCWIRGSDLKSILIATKPFVQRRVFAALPIVWPEIEATISCSTMSLDDYFTPELPPDKVINIMMGDLQRLWVYGRRGWSVPQEIPESVLTAYRCLSEVGFTRQLISEDTG